MTPRWLAPLALLALLTAAVAGTTETHTQGREDLSPLHLLHQDVDLKAAMHILGKTNLNVDSIDLPDIRQVLSRSNVTIDGQTKIDEMIDGERKLDQLSLALQLVFDVVMKPIYLPTSSGISKECKTDVKDANFFQHLLAGEFWIIQMLDSWGKLPDGFVFGNLRSMGLFEECLKVEANYTAKVGLFGKEQRNYTGRYCQVYYGLKEREAPENATKGWRSGIPIEDPALPIPFSYGTCIPSSCTTQDMEMSATELLEKHGLALSHVECYSEDDIPEPLRPADIAMQSILGFLGALVVLGTIYDAITLQLERSHMRGGAWRAVIGFSFYHNLGRIFTYRTSPAAITCIPGLRVITLLWITVALQYEIGTDFTTNTADALKYQDPVPAQIVTNAWLSVDTFIFLTGLVVTHRLLPHLLHLGPHDHRAKAGLFVKNLVRRFLRLSPTILVVALFSASLLRYLSWGPRADVLGGLADRCESRWWRDPLFINNLFLNDHEHYSLNDCLDHCWYTAVDMQLLLVLPLLLGPLAAHRLWGLMWLGLVTIGSILTPLALTLAYDLPPSPLALIAPAVKLQYMQLIYVVPWCRAGPWLVGVWTALFLDHARVKKLNIPKVVVVLGYLAAIALGLALVLGLFPYNHVFPDKDYRDDMGVSAAYGALARPVWALCVAWVVFTCHTGNAGVVNRGLSWSGWVPLGRLSFCMYLVVPLVQQWWAAIQFQNNYYNYVEKLWQSAGVLFVAGVIAVLLACLVELPLRGIVDTIMPSPAQQHERDMKGSSKKNPENGVVGNSRV